MKHFEAWVDDIDEPGLNRSWEVIKECVVAHAAVDREEGQSTKLARALSWKEFVGAFLGKDSTFTMFGMAHELTNACLDIGRGEDLDQVVREADDIAGGHKPRWRDVTDREGNKVAFLQLVWNKDHDDTEH